MDGIRLFLIPWLLEISYVFIQAQPPIHDFNAHLQNFFHGHHGHFLDTFPAFEPFHLHPAFPVLQPSFDTHMGLGLLQPSANSLSTTSKTRNIFVNNRYREKNGNLKPRLVPYEQNANGDSTSKPEEIHPPPRARATIASNTEEDLTKSPSSSTPAATLPSTTASIHTSHSPTDSTLAKLNISKISTASILSTESTTLPPSTVSLQTTTIQASTLPEAEEETSENLGTGIIQSNRTSQLAAALNVNDSRIDLKTHLNNPELKGLLSSANLSIEDAQVFLKLVEKVLEEEVSKRVKQQGNKEADKVILHYSENHAHSEKGVQELTGTNIELSENTGSQNHELKTVNTHLGFDSIEMENLPELPAVQKLNIKPIESGAFNIEPAIEMVESKAEEEASILDKIPSDFDYREREQAAFDKLVGAVNPNVPPISADKNLRIDILEYKKEPVSPSRSLSFAAPQVPWPRDGTGVMQVESKQEMLEFAPQPAQRRKTIMPTHNHPRTPFESLVKDYEYRLSGQNGINDIIKALRNAHIGIYERPTYSKLPYGRRTYK